MAPPDAAAPLPADAAEHEPPIRSVLFGPERSAEHGASLALAQREVAPAGWLAGPFFPRLDDNRAAIARALAALAARDDDAPDDPAQAWLLDNAPLLQAQFEAVREGLPRNGFQRLPRLTAAPLAGLPRIYGVAWAWVAHSDSTLDLGLLQRFLAGYTQAAPLLLRELWALPTTLRVVLLENLRRLADRAVARQAAPQPPDPEQASADHQSIRNAIGSLRALGRADWRSLIHSVHPGLQTLARLPVFATEAPATQDLTLHALEALAEQAGRPEAEVAQRIANLCTHPAGRPDAAQASPLHWVAGVGRPALLAALGLEAGWRERARVALRRQAPALYLGGLGATWVGLLAAVAAQHPAAPALAVALAALPLSEAVIAVAHRLISESAPPSRLPRLHWPDGIPAAERVLVAIPCLLTSERGVAGLLAQLERHHLASHEVHAQYTLLSDFADADTAECPGDAALLAQAQAGIAALNARYPSATVLPRFVLHHRGRTFNPAEGRFIGWERKRGKIEHLLAQLAAETDPRRQVRHLVTLDSDTALAPGTLRALVSLAAHPLHRPEVVTGPDGAVTVQRGHGMWQPRIAAPLAGAYTPGSAEPSPTTGFHRVFAGQTGIDPYSAASSEVYQDLFAEGSATGKGLIDVQAGARVLAGRLPENQVLSHDLLEGSLMRCATVTELAFIEDAPLHADVAASRIHRWTRGDWQLLPFIARPRRWGLGAIHVWKMLDNLRRSLLAPASLALLLAAWAGVGLSPLGALGLVALAWGAGPAMGALAGAAPSRDGIALRRFYRHAADGLLRVAAGTAWHLAMLPAQAALSLDAIARALWRQAVSRRHLLEWTTAAAAEAAARTDWPGLLRQHARLPLGVALLGAALWAAVPAVAWRWALPMLALWALGPVWIALASRPQPVPRRPEPSSADRAYLDGVAREIWDWFERWVPAEPHHLPPDNVQRSPDLAVAARTSPTNIGLYLLSACCAREAGWLDDAGLRQRLTLTLDSIDQLPRCHGHLYNWIDTQRLTTLAPAYVSVVDSGNLCVHALVAAAACQGWGLHEPARRLRALALAHDFKPFYDAQRELLHIGARVDDAGRLLLDRNHYDLLASEARLASQFAIAKGDLPAAHWAALGRPFFARGAGECGLKSWSGSMFEMLMPSLTADEPPGSALHAAALAALAEQQRQGEGRRLPWGVSESAHAVRDQSLAYQYGPKGTPALALSTVPEAERVVAPYASLMAALVNPPEAVSNLRVLEHLRARAVGDGGFIEALDWTAERVAAAGLEPGRALRVDTHMSHHQGMAFVALIGLLHRDAPRRWALAEPLLAASRWLLHEPAPHDVAPLRPPAPAAQPRRATAAPLERRLHEAGARSLPASIWLGHHNSQSRLATLLREQGPGVVMWGDIAISRWREDGSAEHHGPAFWWQDADRADAPWHTLATRPAAAPGWRFGARLRPAMAELSAEGDGLQADTAVWVSPEDDCELRRLRLRNTGPATRQLCLASVFEPVLAPLRADAAHPAFSNLFLGVRWQADSRTLHLARRPRGAHEAPVHALHGLVGVAAEGGAQLGSVGALAQRALWLGRSGSPARPDGEMARARGAARAALLATASGELDTATDPLALIHLTVTLPPGAQLELTFATAAAADPAVLALTRDRLAEPDWLKRTRTMAYTAAAIRTQGAGLDAAGWGAGLWLHTLLSRPPNRALAAMPDLRPIDRDALWRHGISGDAPLALVRIADPAGLPLLAQLCTVLAAAGGPQRVDVVVVNEEPPSYLAPLGHALADLAARHAGSARLALTVLPLASVGDDGDSALTALARLQLRADGRPLAAWVEAERRAHEHAAAARRAAGRARLAPPARHGSGLPPARFDADTGAFTTVADAAAAPARPWVNVLANPHFGCQVSDRGAGMSWAGNSRLHAITPWSNDPLLDPAGEAWLLHCLDSGQAWALGRAAASQAVVHLPGASVLAFALPGLVVRLRWSVDAERAVKQCEIEIQAAPGRPRRLRLLHALAWQLGGDTAARYTVAARVAAHVSGPAVWATQRDRLHGFGGATAFAAWRPAQASDAPAASAGPWPWPAGAGFDAATEHAGWPEPTLAADRHALFDEAGQPVLPLQFAPADAAHHAPADPGALIALDLTLPGGHRAAGTLLLGHGPSATAAEALLAAAWAVDPAARLRAQCAPWQARAGAVQLRSPDARLDALVNHWLPYQVLACRLWARAGFYQAGGAFGYRDQLQDAMGLVHHDPALLAAQIRRHAARQFEAGDVQHWWHEPGGAGVRTRFADDRVWLATAIALHLRHGGSAALLDEAAPFLVGREVPPGVEDVYETPHTSPTTATLYEHGARAIDISLATGPQGLPLFGSGDWNDGMNRVGIEGRGESVWMGWFLCQVLDDWVPIARQRGDTARERHWAHARRQLATALDTHAWDGAWWRRGSFDDGSPLGSARAEECRIDLIAQAWSVLSGAAAPERARRAMDSAWRELREPHAHVLRLLWPPLDRQQPSAGYIQAYPGGVRENGGQYNHAAVWALMAWARLGQPERMWAALTAISPAHRGGSYALEPYAVAGDITGGGPGLGRGGWSWYTGAAGWLLRAVVESLAGVQREGDAIHLRPCLPPHWPGCTLSLLIDGKRLTVEVQRQPAAGALAHGSTVRLSELADGSRLCVAAQAQPPG